MARINWNRPQITLTAQRLMMPIHQRYTHEVLNGARHLAPVAASHTSGSGRPKPGQPLQSSIFGTITMTSTSIKSLIGTRKNYAASIHQGSASHIIRGRGGRMLKFRWERGDFLVAARAGRRRGNRRTGQFHYFVQVRHPGNKRPVQFLTRPLHMFGRFYNYRVISFLAASGPLP
jgi:hypothetical protein